VSVFISWARVASSGHADALPDHPSIARTLDEVTEALGENVLGARPPAALRSTVSVQTALLASVSRWHALSSQKVARRKRLQGCRRSLCRRGGGWRSEPAEGVRLLKLRAERMVDFTPEGTVSPPSSVEGERDSDAGRRSIHEQTRCTWVTSTLLVRSLSLVL